MTHNADAILRMTKDILALIGADADSAMSVKIKANCDVYVESVRDYPSSNRKTTELTHYQSDLGERLSQHCECRDGRGDN